MAAILPKQKNLRLCSNCNAIHAVNGDESSFWAESKVAALIVGVPITNTDLKEENCQFCNIEWLKAKK